VTVSFGAIVGLVFAVVFAVLVGFLALVLVKLGHVLTEATRLVNGITEQTIPLLGEVTTSVSHVNDQLVRVDAITNNVQSLTQNVTALSSVFAATLGGPLVKAAAFSYGVRRALSDRQHADIEKRVKTELKAEKKAAKATRTSTKKKP
jgi:predicted PurR-regulated permease PerM